LIIAFDYCDEISIYIYGFSFNILIYVDIYKDLYFHMLYEILGSDSLLKENMFWNPQNIPRCVLSYIPRCVVSYIPLRNNQVLSVLLQNSNIISSSFQKDLRNESLQLASKEQKIADANVFKLVEEQKVCPLLLSWLWKDSTAAAYVDYHLSSIANVSADVDFQTAREKKKRP
jgi:hypothetical protein